MLQLLATGTVANRESTDLTTAINLANNIHEKSMCTPYDDLFDLEATPSTVAGMPGWTQVVNVSYVDRNRLSLSVPDTQEEPTARVTVTIRHAGNDVYKMSWIAAASE